jgi:sec-independent protein translocase protein TatC
MAIRDFFRKKEQNAGAEMSFIDHLEVLRWHLIRSVIAILIGAVIVFIYSDFIVDRIILGPAHQDFVTYAWFCNLGHFVGIGNALCIEAVNVSFLSTRMTEQFIATFTVAFVGGFIIAFPYVFWEFWRFVKPALTEKEIRQTRGVILWVSLLFFTGVAFGYFVLTPFMINFYFSYKLSPLIEIKPTFSDYVENLVYTTVGIGVLFQMPLLVMVLTRIGIITAKFLKKYRRHAFVLLLIAAAIITPTTDPFSLAIISVPLYLLYEASISIASRINKKQQQQEKSEWS